MKSRDHYGRLCGVDHFDAVSWKVSNAGCLHLQK